MKDAFARGVLIALSAAAAACSVLLLAGSCLARQGTTASLTSAVKLVPFNADYLISLAELQPQNSEALLKQSLKWDPLIADAWIRLGLHAEMQARDPREAERNYIEAARVNRMYVPQWTLAGFYFRQGDRNKFYNAAKSALEITPYDGAPLFSQAYALNFNDGQVLGMLPNRPEVTFSYLQHVLATNRMDAIEPAALKAAAFPPPQTIEEAGRLSRWSGLLGATSDRLIATNQFDAALRIHERMRQTGWTHMPAPAQSSPLANASFQFPITGHGFDWLLNPTPGVTADQMPDLQKIRFALSGTQPEQCRLMQQIVVLEPGRTYGFSWQAESSDFQNPIGLAWRLVPLGQNAVGLLSPDLFPAAAAGTWNFTTPSDSRGFLLTLELKRPLGQVRAEGSFTVGNLSLKLSSEAASNLSMRGFTKP